MSLFKSAYGSMLVTVIVLVTALVAGNAAGGVHATANFAPAASLHGAAQQQTPAPIGEVSGTALPGDAVRVTQGEALIGEIVAGADGTWRVPTPSSALSTTPFRVKILPSARRGAAGEPDGAVTVLVSVVIGSNKVEVRVQVATPNGQIDIEVLAPINPPCENPDQPETQPVYHRVRSGETLSIIAARYGVTTRALMQANQLRNPNLIYAGQRLLIPGR